jgi:hypothetical protein
MAKSAKELLLSAKAELEAFSKLMEKGTVSRSDRESFTSIMNSFNKFEQDMTKEVDHIKAEPRSKEFIPIESAPDSERLRI